ncbi:hypothetical protein PHAVU_006G032000 [Phaseolus vulgaris]|uniref:Uncharacterized protein n=1 Tax=Phaseolus vulgaris TaxID=3885 RepID=V7BP22_PHAVU|nr:hypothetical protein PHAVU_006G032000g [Phaseolus vulgaris]ESW18331.1 hypothetical protein PHAVU_006G032000g [Phaseolus vulgaris]
MLETPTTESSAMKAEGGTAMITNQKKSGFSNIEKKEEVWCTYCNKPRHTREKCWKLHGKPPSREWGQKGGPPKREGQRQAHTPHNGDSPHLNSETRKGRVLLQLEMKGVLADNDIVELSLYWSWWIQI